MFHPNRRTLDARSTGIPHRAPASRSAESNVFETTVIIVAAAGISVIAFIPLTVTSDSLPAQKSLCAFLILLPLMWAGLCGNQRAATAATLIFCGLAGWSLSVATDPISALGLRG